jgi:hypothetical protein
MRFVKVTGIVLAVLALACIAMAGGNGLGIHEVSRINFVAPVRVGSALLTPGDYLVRHTMEGQEHVMVFESVARRTVEAKVKCTLVPLQKKAEESKTVYEMNSANERVLQELVFAGDKAKHVFQN